MQTILKNPNSKKLAQTMALRSGLFIATAIFMSACISQVSSSPNSVEVYKYRGSKQCEGGGLSQPEVEQKLAAIGATIYKKSCDSTLSHDGKHQFK